MLFSYLPKSGNVVGEHHTHYASKANLDNQELLCAFPSLTSKYSMTSYGDYYRCKLATNKREEVDFNMT